MASSDSQIGELWQSIWRGLPLGFRALSVEDFKMLKIGETMLRHAMLWRHGCFLNERLSLTLFDSLCSRLIAAVDIQMINTWEELNRSWPPWECTHAVRPLSSTGNDLSENIDATDAETFEISSTIPNPILVEKDRVEILLMEWNSIFTAPKVRPFFLACVLVFPCLDPQGVLKVIEVFSLKMPTLVRSIFLRNTWTVPETVTTKRTLSLFTASMGRIFLSRPESDWP